MNRIPTHPAVLRWLPAALFAAIVGIMFATQPKNGDIWWMDASRHALNGAFVLDFLRALPLRHPVEFAFDYYRQWPALTILFYPPLFYGFLAVSFFLFGVSEAAALVAEFVAMFFLALGSYRLARNWLPMAPALAVGVLMIGIPESQFWGRQVMLDIPAHAWLVWAAVFHVGFLRGGSPRSLYFSVLCVAAAAYTRYDAFFLAVPFAVSLLWSKGPRFLGTATALRAIGLGIVLLAPLVPIFLIFARYNLDQAISINGAEIPRWSAAALIYYLRAGPHVVSWFVAVPAAVFVLFYALRPAWRLPTPDAVFLAAWSLFGYAFYTMVAVKESRYILPATFPVVLAAVLTIDRTVNRLLARFVWRGVAALAAAGCVLAFSMATRPPPHVTGIVQAAVEVARLAPRDTNVAFWGWRDGTFVFAMRAYGGRADLGVIRLDKLLLSEVAVQLDRGFHERDLTVEQITAALSNLHVQYVVAERDYLAEIAVIARLHDALRSARFVEVATIPMTSNYPLEEPAELVIYRARDEVPPGRVAPAIELKLIGRSI
jgi:4-amino-4-deoxy-L-arabinose transferase-like glycosyltransferase